jgi:adenylate cyclase
VSKVVRDQVLDKLSFTFEDLGAQQVKNIARPVDAYRVDLGGETLRTPSSIRKSWQVLTRGLGWRWLVAGIVVTSLAGIAFWTPLQFWKTPPAPAPPAMSVAIVPFTAPHGDADAARFADALTRDLVTRLGVSSGSRGRARVVSGISAATGGNGVAGAREIGRTLNVRYVVEGDVVRRSDGNSVNVRLIDAATGEQVWSRQDTLRDTDVAAESSANLCNLSDRLRYALVDAEIRRVVPLPLSTLSPRELVLRAFATWDKDQSLAGIIEARKLIDEALRLEPNLEPALVARAWATDFENDDDPHPDHDRIVREMDEYTIRAINLDPSDRAHGASALMRCFILGDGKRRSKPALQASN